MHDLTPQRYPTHAGAERLCDLLDLQNEDWMQDWPLEIADSKRLTEFCNAYDTEKLDTEIRFSLMELILYSLEDLVNVRMYGSKGTTEEEEIIANQRVEKLLRQDFILHLHTVSYWCCHDESDPENYFPITPLLRHIWEECYKPEYGRWLDEDR
jgi:hypothetical protein